MSKLLRISRAMDLGMTREEAEKAADGPPPARPAALRQLDLRVPGST